MNRMGVACTAIGGAALAGCSLLYNPNNLPAPQIDASPPDSEVVPDELVLTAAAPTALLEGQGTGGSRPAVLVIRGLNIAQDASVALVPSDAATTAPLIEIDNAGAVRSPGGGMIAVPVTLPVDPGRGSEAESTMALTVQVMQAGAAGVVMQQLPGVVTLRHLPELDAPVVNSNQLAPLYSRVQVAGGLTFTAGTRPAVIRAVGAIDLGDVRADGAGQAPGPGGGRGGAPGESGVGPGGGRAAGLLNGVLAAGSGGGYGVAGAPGTGVLVNNPGGRATGEEMITSYAGDPSRPPNGGSGGGGGSVNAGGGGGGTLELTAGGTLTAGAISANGGTPTGGNGGGGSGGAIVLRSGAMATLAAISADGGHASNLGGEGGQGRVRYDVAGLAGEPAMTASTVRQGATFSADRERNPLITSAPELQLTLISAKSTDVFKVFVFDAVGAVTDSSTTMFVTPMVTIKPPLNVGYNRICVTAPKGDPMLQESTSCIEVAYVP